MTSSPRAAKVEVSDDSLIVTLVDGRLISSSLELFPRLLKGTHAERSNFELIGDGIGIHWSDLDEDLSVVGLLRDFLRTER